MRSNADDDADAGAQLNQSYERPPITEAVIEIMLATSPSEADLQKIKRRLKEFYPNETRAAEVKFELNANERLARVGGEIAWDQLQNLDAGEICFLKRNIFAVSQLSPYPGWGVFKQRAVRDWHEWRRVAGFIPPVRLGARYINRIDVPASGARRIYLEDYLAAYPHFPNKDTELLNFAMNAVIPVPEEGAQVTINIAQAPSPLVAHYSYILDIDVGSTDASIRKDEDVWMFFDRARVIKNKWFEACVTDKARELFKR